MARIDQELWRKTWAPPPAETPPRLRELAWGDQEAGRAGTGAQALFDRESLRQVAAKSSAGTCCWECLHKNLSQVLGLEKEQVDVHTPIQLLGMDSLMALQLKNRVEAQTGIRMITVFNDGLSAAQIADNLLTQMNGADAPAILFSTSPEWAQPSPFDNCREPVKRLDELPDQDLANILQDLDRLCQQIEDSRESTD